MIRSTETREAEGYADSVVAAKEAAVAALDLPDGFALLQTNAVESKATGETTIKATARSTATRGARGVGAELRGGAGGVPEHRAGGVAGTARVGGGGVARPGRCSFLLVLLLLLVLARSSAGGRARRGFVDAVDRRLRDGHGRVLPEQKPPPPTVSR